MTQNPNPAETTISPKVIAPAVVNVALLVVVAVLTAVTPTLLEPLGPWAALVGAGLAALAAALAGYIKRDPLRRG